MTYAHAHMSYAQQYIKNNGSTCCALQFYRRSVSFWSKCAFEKRSWVFIISNVEIKKYFSQISENLQNTMNIFLN